MYSINIVKESATGERFIGEACSINKVTGEESLTKEQLWEASKEICQLADDRMEEMGLRMLGAYKLLDFLPMEYRMAMHDILDILAGRADPRSVQHKWQSIKEENEALARGREEALAAAQINGENDAEVVS